MGRVEACRICLITDVKMERIQGSLEANIKTVFGHNMMFSSDFPDYSCYECTALITKFSKFRKKYFTAQSLLFNILQNHGVVTEKEIKNIDRVASKLNSNLSTTHTKAQMQLLELKIECDPMEGVPDMTVDDENDNSCGSDDVPLNSVSHIDHVNIGSNNSKQHISSKNKKMNSNNDLGESSRKMKKLHGNNSRRENLPKDFDLTDLTDGTESNNFIYLEAEDVDHELPDADNAFEDYDPSSAVSIKILENQNIMINNQHIIMSKLSELSTSKNTLNRMNAYPTTSTDFLTSTDKVTSSVIDSKKRLEEFENELKDLEKKQKLRQTYTILFKGRGQGINCAYILIDALFTRKFMTQCSWAGGSRGTETKIAFRAYRNTINFFHEVVQECDNNFSLLDCHSFLKSILRNSNKRLSSKQMRMSSQRKRVKRSDFIMPNKKDGLEET